MADTLTKVERSKLMSRIHSTNTKPEMIVRRFLHQNGIRYRLHDKNLPGKPDLKLVKYNCLIFVNGCFWHGHKNCKIYVMPKTNKTFWYKKIEANILRDKKNYKELRKLGWRVVVIWECQLKMTKRSVTLRNLLNKMLTS